MFRLLSDKLVERRVYSLDDLSSDLGVSRITIQRDIILLERRGLVTKVHGGVKLPEKQGNSFETLFDVRLDQNSEKKEEIARKALSFVQDHSTIFIDSSTTCFYFARELLKKRYLDLGIVTNSPAIQNEALHHQDCRLISTGGELRQNFNMLTGKMVIEFMQMVNIDSAFISAAGVSSTWHLTTSNLELAEILKIVISRTESVNLLVDSSKFFKAAMLNIAHINECTRVISDSGVGGELKRDIGKTGDIEVVV
jgi:DeoR/GlpR family transcriptional regulator of sugar metabolism